MAAARLQVHSVIKNSGELEFESETAHQIPSGWWQPPNRVASRAAALRTFDAVSGQAFKRGVVLFPNIRNLSCGID